jgi:hypothetical protein
MLRDKVDRDILFASYGRLLFDNSALIKVTTGLRIIKRTDTVKVPTSDRCDFSPGVRRWTCTLSFVSSTDNLA